MSGPAAAVAHDAPIDPGKTRRAAAGIPVVPAFDGFRGIAILTIVLFHILQNASIEITPESGPLGAFVWAMDAGVGCLTAVFIVSGFVMFLPVAVRGGRLGSVKAFAIRRAARLFPAYFLVLTLILILILTMPYDPPIPFPDLGNIVLTYTTLEVPAELVKLQYFLGFEMDRAVWTLSLEVTFYVLLVFFAARWFRRPLVGLAISAALAVCWRLLFTNVEAISSRLSLDVSPERADQLQIAAEVQFPYWAFAFGVGMTIALVYARRDALRTILDPRRARILQIATVAVFLLAAAVTALVQPESIHYSPILSLLYTGLIGLFMTATIFCNDSWQWPFTNPTVRWLGDIGYGVYLIHVVIITSLARLFVMPKGDAEAVAIWIVAVVPLSILWGYLSARFLEVPIRTRAARWARSVGGRSGP